MQRLIYPFLFSIFLLSSPAIAEDVQQADSTSSSSSTSSFDTAYDSFTDFLQEMAVKFGNLTEENKQTLDELTTDIKNKLNDPNPAASVTVDKNTQRSWDNLNTSSPKLEERNRQLQEENRKMIERM